MKNFQLKKLRNIIERARKYLQPYCNLDFLVLILVACFSWWLMSSTFGYHNGNISIASKLYSDFGAHLPMIRSFSLGWNFPPEYPFFVGEPIRYHYFFYLVVGLLERAGFRLDLALNIPSAIGLTLLLYMIYLYAKNMFRSKVAGVLAICLFLLNGSLAFVEYFDQHGWSWMSIREIPYQVQFASFGPWSGRMVSAFWNWNILTNQRHLSLSYGLVLLVLYPLIQIYVKQKFYQKNHLYLIGKIRQSLTSVWSKIDQSLNRKSVNDDFIKKNWMWIATIVVSLGVMPILHQAGFTIVVPLIIVWLLITWKNSKKWFLTYWLGVLAGGASFIYLTTSSSESLSIVWGFLSPDKSLLGIVNYWWFNLGFYLLLMPVLLVWSIVHKQWWLLTILPFFIIANIFLLSVDMINNHKLITFFLIALSITTAGFLVWLWKKWKPGRLIVVFILPLLTLSGVLDMFPIINDTRGTVIDYSNSTITQWIVQNTKPRSQFVTASYMYNPASLAGRFLFLDYGYHSWSMGYNDYEKRLDLFSIWSPDINLVDWCRVVTKHHIDFVLVGPTEKSIEDDRIAIDASMIVMTQEPAFQSSDGWKIWSTKQLCSEKE